MVWVRSYSAILRDELLVNGDVSELNFQMVYLRAYPGCFVVEKRQDSPAEYPGSVQSFVCAPEAQIKFWSRCRPYLGSMQSRLCTVTDTSLPPQTHRHQPSSNPPPRSTLTASRHNLITYIFSSCLIICLCGQGQSSRFCNDLHNP